MMLDHMQTISSGIWIRDALSISSDNNHKPIIIIK